MGQESKLIERIKQYLKDNNIYYIRMVGSPYIRVGIPDIIICYEGYFIAVECKAPNGKLTPPQKNELTSIANSGGYTMVVRSYEDFINEWRIVKEALFDTLEMEIPDDEIFK